MFGADLVCTRTCTLTRKYYIEKRCLNGPMCNIQHSSDIVSSVRNLGNYLNCFFQTNSVDDRSGGCCVTKSPGCPARSFTFSSVHEFRSKSKITYFSNETFSMNIHFYSVYLMFKTNLKMLKTQNGSFVIALTSSRYLSSKWIVWMLKTYFSAICIERFFADDVQTYRIKHRHFWLKTLLIFISFLK